MKNNIKNITTLVILTSVVASSMQCAAMTRRLLTSSLTTATKRLTTATTSVLLRSPFDTRVFSGKAGDVLAVVPKVSGGKGGKASSSSNFSKNRLGFLAAALVGAGMYQVSNADDQGEDSNTLTLTDQERNYMDSDMGYYDCIFTINQKSLVDNSLMASLLICATQLLDPDSFISHKHMLLKDAIPVLYTALHKLEGSEKGKDIKNKHMKHLKHLFLYNAHHYDTSFETKQAYDEMFLECKSRLEFLHKQLAIVAHCEHGQKQCNKNNCNKIIDGYFYNRNIIRTLGYELLSSPYAAEYKQYIFYHVLPAFISSKKIKNHWPLTDNFGLQGDYWGWLQRKHSSLRYYERETYNALNKNFVARCKREREEYEAERSKIAALQLWCKKLFR